MKGLTDAQGGGKSNKVDTKAPSTAEPVDEASGRLNGEESKKLNDIGRELEKEDDRKGDAKADATRKNYRDRRQRLSRERSEEARRRALERAKQ